MREKHRAELGDERAHDAAHRPRLGTRPSRLGAEPVDLVLEAPDLARPAEVTEPDPDAPGRGSAARGPSRAASPRHRLAMVIVRQCTCSAATGATGTSRARRSISARSWSRSRPALPVLAELRGDPARPEIPLTVDEELHVRYRRRHRLEPLRRQVAPEQHVGCTRLRGAVNRQREEHGTASERRGRPRVGIRERHADDLAAAQLHRHQEPVQLDEPIRGPGQREEDQQHHPAAAPVAQRAALAHARW